MSMATHPNDSDNNSHTYLPMNYAITDAKVNQRDILVHDSMHHESNDANVTDDDNQTYVSADHGSMHNDSDDAKVNEIYVNIPSHDSAHHDSNDGNVIKEGNPVHDSVHSHSNDAKTDEMHADISVIDSVHHDSNGAEDTEI